MSAKLLFWKLLHPKWRPRGPATPGYTALVPVPGDLPVFLKLALAVLRRQDPKHRVETLVVPDVATDRVRHIVAAEQATWPGELRLVELPRPDRWVPRLLNKPHHNHWLQLVVGAEQARGAYVLLHDADLFLHDPAFLRDQFERCHAGGYACFGVHRVWDEWYAERGRNLTATWESFFATDWLRSFAPHRHLGHDGVLDGEPHTFDTTLEPQCLTPAGRIGWHTPEGGLTHFNYVICTYRYFRASRGPFADDQFRLLLVRMLSDLFEDHASELPTATEFERCLAGGGGPVTYGSATADGFGEFRAKVEGLLGGGAFTGHQQALARAILGPFDQHFRLARQGFQPGALATEIDYLRR